MARTDQHDFNYQVTKQGRKISVTNKNSENAKLQGLQSIKTMRELQKGGKIRALPFDDKKENLKPIDHQAAAKKLNDILKLTDPDQQHEDLIKSLPTFGTNHNGVRKSTSFAKHVKRNLDENN